MREIRRLVFLFAGFEPQDAGEQRARFAYAAEKTGALWDAAFDIGALTAGLSGCAEFHVTARGAGWEARTDFVVCDWSDLILAIEKQNPVKRFIYGLAALASFAANGTFLRYCRVSWRYGVFFLIPFILILCALAPLALALLGWTAALAGLLMSGILMRLFISRLYLAQTLDNWRFARAAALGRDLVIEDRIAQFTSAISNRTAAFTSEGGGETVIAAHSLGAHFAAMALSGALAETKPGQPAPGLLMAGSSLLKIALHPKAGKLRSASACRAVRGKLARSSVDDGHSQLLPRRSNRRSRACRQAFSCSAICPLPRHAVAGNLPPDQVQLAAGAPAICAGGGAADELFFSYDAGGTVPL